MINADGKQVMVDGTYEDLMIDLSNIIASIVKESSIDEEDVLKAIKVGIICGMEERKGV